MLGHMLLVPDILPLRDGAGNFICSNVVLLLHVGTTQNGIPCDTLDEYGVVSDSVYFRERCRIHDVMVR